MNKNLSIFRWLFSVIFISIVVLIYLLLNNSADEKLLLWTRYTARVSFIYFIISYCSSSLYYFFPNILTSLIKTDRRYIGLSFAFAHFIHLIALIYYHLTMNEGPNMFLIFFGGFGYIATFIMVITSNDKAVQKLGFSFWKRLHFICINYVAVIFTYVYVSQLLDAFNEENNTNLFPSNLIVVVIFIVLILRLIYSVNIFKMNK